MASCRSCSASSHFATILGEIRDWFRVQGLGLRLFRVEGLGVRILGVQGLGSRSFRGWGLGFRVDGFGV